MIPIHRLRAVGYAKRTASGTTGAECCICGRQTAGAAGARHVAIDHTRGEFVTDAEAAARGENCSLFPIGPECVRAWRAAVGGTSTRLRQTARGIVAYAGERAP